MESRHSARILLCGLILVACVSWTNSFPLPNNTKADLRKLKATIKLSLTDTDRQEGGSFFKEQLQKMEKEFEKDSQRELVMEMLYTYSRLFHQMSKNSLVPEEAQNLHDKVKELLNLSKDYKLIQMQRSIRDYKWNSVPGPEELKALNDFDVVYNTASDLMNTQ